MSYLITIQEIKVETVTENVYVPSDERGEDDPSYRDAAVTKKTSTEIYSQMVDKLNLVNVIDAVNGK